MAIDNSWIDSDRKAESSGGKSRLMRTKVLITVAIILVGGVLALAMNGVGSNATMYQSQGIAIDFGDWSTVWTDIDRSESDDPAEMLSIACEDNNCGEPVFEAGILVSISTSEDTSIWNAGETFANDATHSWGLWYVEKGGYDLVRSDTYDISASDYTVVVWAYTAEGGEPAVAVDATGTSIYGYAMPDSMVTLSPVSTEIVGSMDAVSLLVGTDSFSNYPESVVQGQRDKVISIMGTYTDPSYEAIMHASPDMVVCDSSQYTHVQMANTLRSSDVNAVVIYDGDSIETVLNNIFIVGTAMNYNLRAAYVDTELGAAMDALSAAVSGHDGERVLVTLGNSASPYVAGTDTYVEDILTTLNSENVVSRSGWPNITAENILSLNPSCIIVLDYGTYTADEYDLMMGAIADEWKSTDAYKSGNVYMLCEGLGEMAERAGPRFSQLAEIMARITVPDAFDDGIVLPKAIGDDYEQYLTYTAALGFE